MRFSGGGFLEGDTLRLRGFGGWIFCSLYLSVWASLSVCLPNPSVCCLALSTDCEETDEPDANAEAARGRRLRLAPRGPEPVHGGRRLDEAQLHPLQRGKEREQRRDCAVYV